MRARCGGGAGAIVLLCAYVVPASADKGSLSLEGFGNAVEDAAGDAADDFAKSASGGTADNLTDTAWQSAREAAHDLAKEAKHIRKDLFKEAREEGKSLAKQVAKEAHEALSGSRKHHGILPTEDPNHLGGHGRALNNWAVVLLLGAVGTAALAGRFAVAFFSPAQERAWGEHPKAWVVGMLLASYAALLPGITATLFSFNIFLSVHLGILGNLGYNVTHRPITESMSSLVGLLSRTGSHIGAFFVVLYAIVAPAVKLLLLGLGEWWRDSGDPGRRRVANWCIRAVRVISKWASPDLFAYILLLYLFRALGHRMAKVHSEAMLDVGFACFGVFCLFSTIATLAIRPPSVHSMDDNYAGVHPESLGGSGKQLLLRSRDGRRYVAPLVAILAVVFAALLAAGLVTPCMGLRVDTGAFVEPRGPVPKSMAWLLEEFKIAEGLQTDVTLRQCMAALAGWSAQGEATSLLAFVMLAGFAVALTVLDMVALLVAAWGLDPPGPSNAMAVAHVLKHASMLDVFCMGVVVVCYAGQAYSSQGFNLELMRGMVPLISAEVVHWATYHIVAYVTDGTEKLAEGEAYDEALD